MSLTIEPGALRDADTINAVLQEAEDKVNTVLRDSMLPNGIIPEVLLSGLVNEIAHCGEVSSTEVTITFSDGAASSWSTLLSLTEDFSGSGYGDDEQQMQVIEIDDATCGGVVVEWDLCLDRITSWEAPTFEYGHAYGTFVVEVVIEVCNNTNTSSHQPITLTSEPGQIHHPVPKFGVAHDSRQQTCLTMITMTTLRTVAR
jgi:hypothetical protein